MNDTSPSFFGSVLKAIACTRNRNFNDKQYERGVIDPSRRIRAMMKASGQASPSIEQMRESLNLLDRIFETKQVESEERNERIREIVTRNQLHHLFPQRVEAHRNRNIWT